MKGGFFEHPRSVGTIYCDKEGDSLADCRFLLARFGEDPSRVVEAFWNEWPAGNFQVAPIFSYGLPPRRSLCTPQSLAAALRTFKLEPNSELERQWREACEYHGVPWTKQKQNSTIRPAKDAA
jgi:hypothetical protein